MSVYHPSLAIVGSHLRQFSYLVDKSCWGGEIESLSVRAYVLLAQ